MPFLLMSKLKDDTDFIRIIKIYNLRKAVQIGVNLCANNIIIIGFDKLSQRFSADPS